MKRRMSQLEAKVRDMLEAKRNDYARLRATPEKEFGGKRKKEIHVAQFGAQITVLQDLLMREDDG